MKIRRILLKKPGPGLLRMMLARSPPLLPINHPPHEAAEIESILPAADLAARIPRGIAPEAGLRISIDRVVLDDLVVLIGDDHVARRESLEVRQNPNRVIGCRLRS